MIDWKQIKNLFLFQEIMDYLLKYYGGECEDGNIPNDTILFRKFMDPIKWINGDIFIRK